MESAKAALGILEQALKTEQEGHQFYLKAARITQDEKGRETFAMLADDEQKHYRLIARQRDFLATEGRWVAVPEVKTARKSPDQPLFPANLEAVKKTVSITSSDREAILFGLEIETKGYNLYRDSALETPDPLGREMFEFLAGEERGHYDILMMRYDLLFGPVAWQA